MFISHMGKKNLFSNHLKNIFQLCFDTLDIQNNSFSFGLLRDHSKDDFCHKPTSSRFTHVYHKREKKCAFFASNIICHFLSNLSKVCFSLTRHGLPSSYVDCTFYITCSCKFSSFFFLQWLCLSLEVAARSILRV